MLVLPRCKARPDLYVVLRGDPDGRSPEPGSGRGLNPRPSGIVVVALRLGVPAARWAPSLWCSAEPPPVGLSDVAMRRRAPPDMLKFMARVSAAAILPAGRAFPRGGRRAPVWKPRTSLGVGASSTSPECHVAGGFAVRGVLIAVRQAATVAPFSMSVPCSSGWDRAAPFLCETSTPLDLLAGALVIGGVLDGARSSRMRPARRVPT